MSSHIYSKNPEGTQIIVGSMSMGYISDNARNRTHNLFRPKREPIPLGHSDGQFCCNSIYSNRSSILFIFFIFLVPLFTTCLISSDLFSFFAVGNRMSLLLCASRHHLKLFLKFEPKAKYSAAPALWKLLLTAC